MVACCFVKNNRGTSLIGDVNLLWPLEYIIKKISVPTKQATVILAKVERCSALLHMLLVRFIFYLKISSEIWISNFGYLSSGHPYIRGQGCEDPWLFFKTERGPWAKTFGKYWLGGQSPAFHRSAGVEPRPVRVGVAVVKVLLGQVFLEYFGLHLSVPFHQYSALPVTHACIHSSTFRCLYVINRQRR